MPQPTHHPPIPNLCGEDLNPLALYTKSSVTPEDIVLKELGYHSQQHYFNEDREISPQSKESDLYTLVRGFCKYCHILFIIVNI